MTAHILKSSETCSLTIKREFYFVQGRDRSPLFSGDPAS